MTELHLKSCEACSKNTPHLTKSKQNQLLKELSINWKIQKTYLVQEFRFKNFKEALDFTNKVAIIAESQAHHPDIYLSWAKVELKITTHSINNLTENDFILAAHIDKLDF